MAQLTRMKAMNLSARPRKARVSVKPQVLNVASKSKKKSRRRARKRARRTRAKGLGDRVEESIPQIWQGLGAGVPSIWRGIRSLFNFKEQEQSPQTAITSIPAAFSVVMNNQAFDGPEQPCIHPTLGIRGIRFEGSQFLFRTQYAIGGTPMLASTVPGTMYAWNAIATPPPLPAGIVIPVQPVNFGGKLAFRSFIYQRYRFNYIRLRFVSTCGVTQTGSMSAGYWKDFARLMDEYQTAGYISFDQVMDTVPSVAVPNAVPLAALNVPYEGNELYYIGSNDGAPYNGTDPAVGNWGDAQNRQEVQGALVLVQDSVNPLAALVPIANVFVDYDIECYDPSDVQDILPTNVGEMRATRRMLQRVRQVGERKKPTLAPQKEAGSVEAFIELLDRSEQKDCSRSSSVKSSSSTSFRH